LTSSLSPPIFLIEATANLYRRYLFNIRSVCYVSGKPADEFFRLPALDKSLESWKITIKNAGKRKFPAVGLSDTLDTALQAMAKANASALVVKTDEDLVGVVTISDIMYSLTNEDDLHQTPVSSIMTSCEFISDKATNNPCVQLDEDEDVLSAIK